MAIVCGTSILQDNVPEVSGFVRGDAIISGFLLQPLPDKPGFTRIINLAQMDPKGWVPTPIINSSKRKTLERILNLRACIKK